MNKKAAGEGVDVPTRDRISSTLAALPYARHLGIRVAEVDGAGAVVFHLPFEARLIGNVTLPAYHGGVVASFMQVAALTATYVLHDEDRPPKLVDFSIDYLSSAGPLDLFARCEMHRVGKRVAAVGISLLAAGSGCACGLGPGASIRGAIRDGFHGGLNVRPTACE